MAVFVFFIGCSNTGSNSSLAMLLAGGNSQTASNTALSNDTSITSSIGEVQGSALIKIPFGTTVEVLKAGISVAQGASCDIYEADGETPATQLTGNCIIGVTAEDGTKAAYTLGILPDPAILDEWIGFNPASPEYTINNAPMVEGYNGNSEALSFDGSPATLDYVRAPDNDGLTLRNSGTIEILIKANSFFPFAGIVHKGEKNDFSDEAWGIQLWDYAGSSARLLLMITGDDGNWIGVNGSFNLQPGQWYHIIGTWDATSLRLYVNGVLDGATVNTTGGVRDTSGGLIVGAQLSEIYNGSYGNLGWDGVIDRVIIRSDAVSDAWVLARYNSL
jgi:hypothetical protein